MGSITYKCTDNFAAKCEGLLNRFDHFPIASSYSGVVRFIAAEAQVIAGLAFAALKAFQFLLDGKISSLREMKEGFIHCYHGTLNIIRAAIAVIPILGNLILWLYDSYVGRMNYKREELKAGVYPIIKNFQIPRELTAN